MAGADVRKVVHDRAVGHVAVAAGGGDRQQVAEQLGLAVEASIGVVARVGGVLDLGREDHPVREAEVAREAEGHLPLRGGERRRVGGDGQGPLAEHAVRAHR